MRIPAFFRDFFRRSRHGLTPPESLATPSLGLEKVARFWANSPSLDELRLISWMEHPRVERYINSRTTGHAELTWFPYVNQKYIPTPVSRALSLGCGTGGLERHALNLGIVETFDAIDISSGSIDEARKAASNKGFGSKINYMVADLNNLKLSPQEYGAVFASMSIHHVEALEELCGQISLSLLNGGYFICNEYIGPNRFQLPDDRLQLINQILSILPVRYRQTIRDGMRTSDIKTVHQNPSITWYEENDPSEAVRSADIMPVLRQYFHIIEYRPYGGSILHFLLENIVGNFQDGQKEDDAWLDILTFTEQLLEERAVIESDFALIVGTPIKQR